MNHPSRLATRCAGIALALLSTACTIIPLDGDNEPSYHRGVHASGRIAAQLAAHPPPNADADADSAVRLQLTGYQAWEDRLRLTQLADQSLDLQYFSWDVDETGLVLMSHVIDAADRGVKVRLLLDDMMAIQQDFLSKLDAHDNIQVRLFNPFATQRINIVIRPFEWLAKERLNARMHNKLFIADGLVGILGGRNIENRYFWLDEAFNHRDVDALVTGEVVSELQASFDSYWNSTWAVPLARLEGAVKPRKARRYYRALRRYREGERVARILAPAGLPPLAEYRLADGLRAARIEVVADRPEKVEDREPLQFRALDDIVLREAGSRVLLGMAYLIPNDLVWKQIGLLRERGVDVAMITNSMASIDFPAAFSGYAAAREDLLDMGVTLYEFASDARYPACARDCADVHMSYHAKFVVIDERLSYVGTMNYDPRSIDLNLEIGVIIHDPGIAAQLTEVFFEDAGTRNSWQLARAGTLRWVRPRPNGTLEVLGAEPFANTLNKIGVKFWRLMPLADQY